MLVPKPAAQGLPIFQYPQLAAAKQAQGGGANVYGNLVELLSDVNNTSDAWVIGLQLVQMDTANNDYFVALSREAAGGAPTKIEAEVPTHSQTTVAADHHEVLRFDPPVYFPSGTGIRMAIADSTGAKKLSAWAIVSRNRG
jgi:bifunctional ADP-heptose synthase (sugar kinase/adenylyltransferase)